MADPNNVFKVKPGWDEQVMFKMVEGKLTPINLGTSTAKYKSYGDIKPASSALLKKVYDDGAEFERFIKAPKDYKAPWQK